MYSKNIVHRDQIQILEDFVWIAPKKIAFMLSQIEIFCLNSLIYNAIHMLELLATNAVIPLGMAIHTNIPIPLGMGNKVTTPEIVHLCFWPRRLACLHAPCVAWPLLLPSFNLSLSLLRLLLFTHFGESPVREHLFPPIFWHN